MSLARTGDVILCLHNIVERHGDLGTNRGLDLTIGELETAIRFLLDKSYKPATLDEIVYRLESEHAETDRRFAITFDDGYAGNFYLAYPFLRRERMPFTIYVTTGFIDRTVSVWWYALERLLIAVDRVAFEHAGRMHIFSTLTPVQKIRAYHAIRTLLMEAPPAGASALLKQLFHERDISALGADDVLTPEQISQLSEDPLVTIGGHSVSHTVLRTLPAEDSLQEIKECRLRLKIMTGRPVRHFAYPFGNRAAFGLREERFVIEAGYATAATTNARCLAPGTRSSALPRIMLTGEVHVVTALRALMTGWFGRNA